MIRTEDRLIEIARRKQRLIARAGAQRGVIAKCFEDLHGPISIADKGMGVVRFLRAHPLIVGIAMAAITVFRGRRLVSVAGRGLTLWRFWRSLSA